jgi:hypothetical protein
MKLAMCIAGLFALALVSAGCGDDDNGTLSYEDTGAEISAICADVDDLGEGLTGEPKNDAPILEEAAPDFEAAINEVSELEVNEELESVRDEFVANGEGQLALVEQALADAKAGDKKAYLKTLNSGQDLDRESSELANQLGAEECID